MADVLKCTNLVKSYSGAQPILKGINLTLPQGKIIGLLGPNGAGKTTLIKLIAGLLTPTMGSVEVAGYPIGEQSKQVVSYLPERTYLPTWMRVDQCLDYFCDFYADFDRGRAEKMLESLQVPLNAKLGTLSKGTKEKVQLVLVMARRAKLYLLDEPIAGVDPAARDFILNTVISNYDRESTVLISTHLIADIEQVLDEFLFIQNGNILMYNSVDNARVQYGKSIDELFREVFRCYPY
ncbi:MAG: ABC transporter ATP-binding protein [Eubacteriales bacterium]